MNFYLYQESDFKKIIKEGIKIITKKNMFYYAFKNDKKEDKKTEYEFRLFKDEHPPFWYYDEKENKHIIAIPDKQEIIEQDEMKSNYIKADTIHSILHEFAHSLFTRKNIKETAEYLKSKEVPFDVLNIVEDIRIENELSKKFLGGLPIYYFVEKYIGEKIFDRKIIQKNDSFKTIIFKLLYHQGLYTKHAYSNMTFLRIEPYLKRIKEANERTIVDIAVDFYNEFKEEFEILINYVKNPENLKNDNEAKTIAEKADIKSEISKDEKEILENSEKIEIETMEDSDVNLSIKFDTDKNKTHIEKEGTNYNFFNDVKNEPTLTRKDYEDIKKIKKDLMKLSLKNKDKIINSDFNIEEININGVIDFVTKIDTNAPINKKTINKDSKLKKIHFFLDLSGSMADEPIINAVKMLIAINELYYKYKTTSTITLHKNSKYQTIRIPMNSQDIINLIDLARGGIESIDIAIKNTEKKYLKESDLIIAITDAQVSMQDKKALLKLLNNPKAFIVYTGDKDYFNSSFLKKIEHKVFTSKEFLDDLIKELSINLSKKKISKRRKI